MSGKERGVNYLLPAQPVFIYDFEQQSSIDLASVEQFAGKLQIAIDTYHRLHDPWVQSIGGRSYSEITAISQLMLLTFIRKDASDDIEKFAGSSFARSAHLVWRTVSAIDDVVDQKASNEPIDLYKITDSEGTPVTVMLKQLLKIPHGDAVAIVLGNHLLNYIQHHEKQNDISYQQSLDAKKKTTGRFTTIATIAAIPFLARHFPKEMYHFPIPILIINAINGSIIAQLIDDMVDLPTEIGNPTASSLVIAAARQCNELDELKEMVKEDKTVSIASLVNDGFIFPRLLMATFLQLRDSMDLARQDMKDYFTHQFLYSHAKKREEEARGNYDV